MLHVKSINGLEEEGRLHFCRCGPSLGQGEGGVPDPAVEPVREMGSDRVGGLGVGKRGQRRLL